MKFIFTFLLLFFPLSFYGESLPIKLRGRINDSTVKYIRVVKFSPFWRDFDKPYIIYAEDQEYEDGVFQLDIKISQPQVLSLMVLNKTQSIFVTPGDDISFSIIKDISGPKFSFNGHNSAHYSFSDLLDEYIKSQKVQPSYNKEKGVIAYKSELDNWLALNIQFLKDYRLSNSVSEAFFDYAKNNIETQYIRYMYAPLGYFSLGDMPVGYFDLADSLFNEYNYTMKHVTSSSLLAFTYKYILYSGDHFIQRLDSIHENILDRFKGETRSYLIANLIGVYAKEQSDDYRSSLVKVISNAQGFILDTLTLSYIQRQELAYTKLNRYFPEEILRTTYLKKIDGNSKISLNDLLDIYKGQAIYIDFWASWCVPCREDNANSAKAKEFLNERGIQYIYISLDTKANEKRWKKAVTDDKIINNQYILDSDFKAPLSKYLKINSIPRYIILDKEHKVKSVDAPRPNPSHTNKLKAYVINAKI